MSLLDRLFRLQQSGSTPATEARAGLTTFLTMGYILFVNPQILSQAGLPAADVAFATAVASAVATLIMGLWANYPFALAPGMGLNAYFTFSVVLELGVGYPVALAAVFVEGLLFLLLSVGGVRSAVLRAIPATLKTATMSGIGLFLALIGLQNAGLVADDPATLLTLGDVQAPLALLALAGLLLTAVLLVRRIKGALLIGILAAAGTAWLTGLTAPPAQLLALPSWPEETFLAFDFQRLLSAKFIMVILAFLFVDFFDTAGTLMGVGQLGGFVDESGDLPRSERAFAADAIGTSLGALLGTSTVTTYVESATGVEEGGRTGLTAVVVAALFVGALFFTPVFVAVPAAATAPSLVVVGALMMRGAAGIDWHRMDEALPAFLTIIGMPFTYSIANGIVLGVISYVGIKLLTGRAKEVSPILVVLAVLTLLYYGFGGGL